MLRNAEHTYTFPSTNGQPDASQPRPHACRCRRLTANPNGAVDSSVVMMGLTLLLFPPLPPCRTWRGAHAGTQHVNTHEQRSAANTRGTPNHVACYHATFHQLGDSWSPFAAWIRRLFHTLHPTPLSPPSNHACIDPALHSPFFSVAWYRGRSMPRLSACWLQKAWRAEGWSTVRLTVAGTLSHAAIAACFRSNV
jgi:hypothetical protein